MDSITKALIFDNQVQAIAIISTDIVNTAIKTHGLTPVCSAALGRTLSITAMMASDLKNKNESLSISIKGNGPVGSIMTACDGALNLRGYVDNPDVDIPLKRQGKLDVSGAVGNSGKITVIKDIGLKNAYIGQSEIVSGEIAEDFANYFAKSQQQPCILALGVLIDTDYKCLCSCGLLLNILPNCSEEVITKLEEISGKIGNISSLMKNKTSKEFLADFFINDGILFKEELFPVYKCKCNRQTIDKVIISLGKEQALEDIDKEDLKVLCHFCNTEYKYNKQQVLSLFE